MQIAVIEYARHRAGLPEAHSGEFDEQCKDKVIDFMPGQSDDIDKGGTLRLGNYLCHSARNENGALLSRAALFRSVTATAMNSVTNTVNCLPMQGW